MVRNFAAALTLVSLVLVGDAWARSVPFDARTPDFRSLARKAIPAVVSIQVEQTIARSNGKDPRMDFFHRFFGGEVPREFHNRGIGTGFVIDSSGLILTNYHVVEKADNIEVSFALEDGSERKLSAKVIGTAPQYDVALIQTKKNAKSPVCKLGDSDASEIGDWVMAVGNPFGLSHSVSVGIISAKERRDIEPSGRRGLYNFIQTDASINPGNSGGPLLNAAGEVIAINSAINAAGSGIGFAIPINMVKAMLPDLKTKGRYVRSWIGIRIQRLTPELAKSYGLERSKGALISEVVPGGPAEAAGLQEGDVILEFDGRDVRSSSDLPLYASMAGVGKRIKLGVWRNGRKRSMSVTLQPFPEDATAQAQPRAPKTGALGITVADITPELRNRLGLTQQKGAVITEINPHGPAYGAGLRMGDVILSLNGRAINSSGQFANAARKIKSGQYMRVKVARRNGRMFFALRKP